MKNLLVLLAVCALCVFPVRGAAADSVLSEQTAVKTEHAYKAFLSGKRGGTTASAARMEEKSARPVVSVGYAPKSLLERPGAFHAFIADPSEQQAKVIFSASVPVTNVRVLALQLESVSDAGEVTFSARERYALAVLTSEKPLVVGMVFMGTIPNLGVAYVDGTGMERVYAISQSGEDGKPLLTKATVKW